MAKEEKSGFFGDLSILRNYKLVTLFVILVTMTSLYLAEKYLNHQFQEKSQSVAANIIMSIDMMEKEMDNTLNAAQTVVRLEMDKGSLTKEKLQDMMRELRISGISIYDKSGKMLVTNRDVLDKNYKYSFFKDLRLTDVNQCETQMCDGKLCRITESEIVGCKIKRSIVKETLNKPGIAFEMPMTFMLNKPRVSAKWVHAYDAKHGKIIDVLYKGSDVNKILDGNINIHNGYITYLSMIDNVGDLISEVGANLEKNVFKLTIPFGKPWAINIDGKDFSGDSTYILNAEFSIKELTHQIWMLRILFGIIFLLLILLIVSFGTRLEEMSENIDSLHRKLDAYRGNGIGQNNRALKEPYIN